MVRDEHYFGPLPRRRSNFNFGQNVETLLPVSLLSHSVCKRMMNSFCGRLLTWLLGAGMSVGVPSFVAFLDSSSAASSPTPAFLPANAGNLTEIIRRKC
ncbi:hypothetical protein AVEN_164885-1 [Araneus ventricosus]|uniref:Uncharacterized protein n=1 Tax=Araneus ventricosus TaxID=182803 RepID=A0A4Y2DVA8_ARAVE|nr:hypothetical protein AVEN_164885-1 [Araneus ventricosus]